MVSWSTSRLPNTGPLGRGYWAVRLRSLCHAQGDAPGTSWSTADVAGRTQGARLLFEFSSSGTERDLLVDCAHGRGGTSRRLVRRSGYPGGRLRGLRRSAHRLRAGLTRRRGTRPAGCRGDLRQRRPIRRIAHSRWLHALRAAVRDQFVEPRPRTVGSALDAGGPGHLRPAVRVRRVGRAPAVPAGTGGPQRRLHRVDHGPAGRDEVPQRPARHGPGHRPYAVVVHELAGVLVGVGHQ